jgi:hypothetical protein
MTGEIFVALLGLKAKSRSNQPRSSVKPSKRISSRVVVNDANRPYEDTKCRSVANELNRTVAEGRTCNVGR